LISTLKIFTNLFSDFQAESCSGETSMSTGVREKSENALAGVDYNKMKGFKEAMQQVSARTKHLCEERNVQVLPAINAHGAGYRYTGRKSHMWVITKEGLGNKAWIAMLLNQIGLEDPTGRFHFGGLGIDTFLMGANDNAAHGAMPVILTDEVSCGSDDFFSTPQAKALAASYEHACYMAGCSLVQGESPAYKYLMKAEPPVQYAPSMSVAVVGLCAPAKRYITAKKLRPGDVMIGFTSSGLHANGISPVIRRVMPLPDNFLTKLNGWTVGQEALIPTRSYLGLVDAFAENGIDVHAHLPITGDGIGKIGSDERFSYTVHTWLQDSRIPPLFRFMLEIGMTREGIAETFNCGIGWVTFVPKSQVQKAMDIALTTKIDGEEAAYEPIEIGYVNGGSATGTIFSPWGLALPPPGRK
jgi:phosphoribosylformylglycinamidine cyclo-ligase